ncbi:hypothetical protein ES708_21445 [subsurface metagenome]
MKEQKGDCILLYRHSNGYPDSVVPDLKEFLRWNGGRNSDIEYAAAAFSTNSPIFSQNNVGWDSK